MRKVLCNSLAYQLMEKVKEVGMELAHVWFMDRAKEEELKNSEIFYVVLLAGGIHDHMVSDPPKTVRKAPWEIERGYKDGKKAADFIIADEAHHPIKPGEFTQLVERSKTKSKVNPKQAQGRAPTRPMPSSSCLRDAKKARGVFPYDEPGNYLVGDGYFARDCISKYGEKMWDYACELVRKQK